jgi:hypothetical protein
MPLYEAAYISMVVLGTERCPASQGSCSIKIHHPAFLKENNVQSNHPIPLTSPKKMNIKFPQGPMEGSNAQM